MINRLISFLKKPWLALLISVIVLILCVLPSKELPENVNDKLAHVIAFMGVSAAWFWCAPNVWRVLFGTLVFGIAIEFIQSQLPVDFHRLGDGQDVLADMVGVLPGYVLYLISGKVLKVIA